MPVPLWCKPNREPKRVEASPSSHKVTIKYDNNDPEDPYLVVKKNFGKEIHDILNKVGKNSYKNN